ncbi:MAG TPA: hypothetical protein VFH17_06845 [Coriobacteriia bacterium]|nr:hypothetical protein [Coriobacteriia bacterium]
MARGTRLFQAPRSPLIQGRSRLRRPWWQPYAVAVAVGLVWPLVAFVASALAESGAGQGPGGLLWDAVTEWLGCLPVLAPVVIVGAAAGVAAGTVWGVRRRWLAGTVVAVVCWYLVLAVRAFAG